MTPIDANGGDNSQRGTHEQTTNLASSCTPTALPRKLDIHELGVGGGSAGVSGGAQHGGQTSLAPLPGEGRAQASSTGLFLQNSVEYLKSQLEERDAEIR